MMRVQRSDCAGVPGSVKTAERRKAASLRQGERYDQIVNCLLFRDVSTMEQFRFGAGIDIWTRCVKPADQRPKEHHQQGSTPRNPITPSLQSIRLD
jgi:hypothetical protein